MSGEWSIKMVLEVAILQARNDNSARLVAAMVEEGGCNAMLTCAGCLSVEVLPGVENQGSVLFLVKWESTEAHAAAYGSSGFARAQQIAGEFIAKDEVWMQHFRCA
jgi:quinol monooxygenase YgiN